MQINIKHYLYYTKLKKFKKNKPIMYQHKQPRPPTQLPHKIQLLESNTNRLQHQHQSLRQLLTDNNKINRYRQSMEMINQTIYRFDRFKQNADRVLSNVCIVGGRCRWVAGDGRYQGEVREMQGELGRLREIFMKRKKDQFNSSKSISTNLQQKLAQVKQQNTQELQLLQKNVHKYLANAKKQIIANHEVQVLNYANSYLQKQAGAYCDDVEADIGMLMCELQYLLQRKDEVQVEKDIKGIKMEDNSKTSKSLLKQQENQLSMGKLQRQVIYKKLNQFIPETSKRIAYNCHLLHKKIQQAVACLKSNSKSKHKNPTLPQKYDQEQKQFNSRLHKIENEIEGMKMKISHWQNKIKILDYKIRKIQQKGFEKQYSCGEAVDYGEVQKNFTICKEKLMQFTRLKVQFIL